MYGTQIHVTHTQRHVLSHRLLQGDGGVWYCASWATPGNAHDLSLLSGFAAAHAAIGAPYPFPDDKLAHRDFLKLRRLMGL